MTVESDLEEMARKAAAYLRESESATDHDSRQRFADMRRVVLMDASGLVARSPEALKLKAGMLQENDYLDRQPAAGVGFLLRSLLRDLKQWEPRP